MDFQSIALPTELPVQEGPSYLDTARYSRVAVRLALGEALDVSEPYDAADDFYMVRDTDVAPVVFHADELFETIEDARS